MSSLAAVRRKLARARRLSLADWGVVAESWWELLRADIAVSVRPYASWRDSLESLSGDSRPRRNGEPIADRLVELFGVAARHHVRPMNCLRRAIALRALLERRGYAVAVRFGVRRVDRQLDAHAWLVVNGRAVDTGDTVRDHYQELYMAERGAAQ